MQRTFITGYTYDVLAKGSYKKLGTLEVKGAKQPGLRKKIEKIVSSGFPADSTLSRPDVHTATYEFSDELVLNYGTLVKIDGNKIKDLANDLVTEGDLNE